MKLGPRLVAERGNEPHWGFVQHAPEDAAAIMEVCACAFPEISTTQKTSCNSLAFALSNAHINCGLILPRLAGCFPLYIPRG